MNQTLNNLAFDGIAVPAGQLGGGFALAAAPELKPDFVFAAGTPHELRIGQNGISFRGQTAEDSAQEVYQALRGALGVSAARGVRLFRNRGPGGIWVEADDKVLEIIANSESGDRYEVRTMYARPRSPLTKAKIHQLAIAAGVKLTEFESLCALVDAVRAEP